MTVSFLATDGSLPRPHAIGDKLLFHGVVSLTGSYVTNGDTWDPTPLLSTTGQGVIDYIDLNSAAGYVFAYDYSAKKLKIYSTGPGSGNALAELAAGAYPAGLTSASIRTILLGQ